MNRGQQFIQAYKNAPWRQQLQVIGLFSGTLVALAVVAGVYLTVTAQAATYGREIQLTQDDIQEVEQDIEDLEAQLAFLTSARYMQQRAAELGYQPVQTGRAVYLEVPGYGGRQTAELAAKADPDEELQPQLPPTYTESLLDWFRKLVYQIGIKTGASEVFP